jgi:hypothetical protein
MTLATSARFGPYFDAVLKPHFERAGYHETAAGINSLIRRISPLADTGKFPHFPPFRQGAFVQRRPFLRAQNRTYLKVSRNERKKSRLPKNETMYREYTNLLPLLAHFISIFEDCRGTRKSQ